MRLKNLSVFFPCVNEEGNIENTVSKAIVVLDKLNLEYEIIIIDDGSTDRTGKIADSLASKNPKIRVVHHPKNLGYGEALKSGLYNAKYPIIVYNDGDGQFDFSEVTKFIDKLDKADLIIGHRIKRRDPFFRLLFAKGWALSLFIFFRLRLRDVDCGFKLIKRAVLEKIPKLESQRGAMINAELAIKAKKAGFRVSEVGVNHYPRIHGKPTGASLKVIIKSYLDLIRLWWQVKKDKPIFIILVLILMLASFLRFFKLANYMTFLGDEGRDALVIRGILIDHHLPAIGPPTSVGNIYLGPLYYYMMAISMAIFWLNPVAAAGMDALIGVLTVFLIYFVSKRFFGKISGLIAAFLYAISPVTIIYSRSSWNPNPAPFFSLLGIYGLYKVKTNRDFRWLILSGLAIGAAVQMHYLALLLIPIASFIWIIEALSRKSGQNPSRYFLSGTVLGILSFILVMSPLIWFDLRHQFLNYRAIKELFVNTNTVQGNLLINLNKMPGAFVDKLIGRYLAGENKTLSILLSALSLIPLLSLFIPKIRNKVNYFAILVLYIWLFLGLFGVSFYQQAIYDHYLGFLNPAPYLLIGSLFVLVQLSKSGIFRWVTLSGLSALILVLAFVNLDKNPLKNSPNNQLERTKSVARFVISQSENKDFNFALLSKNNYDAAYQFYLDRYGHPPKQVPFDITPQLFVVCEDPICDPINNSKFEIAGFGWAKIVSTFEVDGVKVLKLVHNPSGKP